VSGTALIVLASMAYFKLAYLHSAAIVYRTASSDGYNKKNAFFVAIKLQ
jgi:hypothetical protein